MPPTPPRAGERIWIVIYDNPFDEAHYGPYTRGEALDVVKSIQKLDSPGCWIETGDQDWEYQDGDASLGICRLAEWKEPT